MITKISKIGQDIYSVNDSEIPLNQTSVINLGINLGVKDTEKLMDDLDKKGSIEIKTAERGTVVNVYEVEYPTPKNPDEETQEMAQHLDEYEDFITQNLFPGVESEDVVITTEESLEANKPQVKGGPGRLFTEKELRELNKRPVLKQSSSGRKYIKLYKTALFGPDIEIHESDSDEIKLCKKILRIARGINHNGDYGDVFYKPDEKKIWWVSADGDGDPSEGSDTSDMIKEKFLALDEVNDVVVEAESYPNEEGWIGIKQEIIPVIEKREIKKEGWIFRLRDEMPKNRKESFPEARKRAKQIIQLLDSHNMLRGEPEFINIVKLTSHYRLKIRSFYPFNESKTSDAREYIYSVEKLLDANGFEDCLVKLDYLGDVSILVPFQPHKEAEKVAPSPERFGWREVL